MHFMLFKLILKCVGAFAKLRPRINVMEVVSTDEIPYFLLIKSEWSGRPFRSY